MIYADTDDISKKRRTIHEIKIHLNDASLLSFEAEAQMFIG